MKRTGVLIEFREGRIKEASLGMITCARKSGEDIVALVINQAPQDHIKTLADHGVQTVAHLIAGEKDNPVWHPAHWGRAVISAMEQLDIHTLFGLTSPVGREVLPRVAAHFDAPLVMNCVDVDSTVGTADTVLYSGKIMARVQVTGDRRIFGIRPGVLHPEPAPRDAAVTVMDAAISADPRITHLSSHVKTTNGVDLTEADIIISGGRAMKSHDNFEVLNRCADAVGAAVGASRVAVDMGWAPYTMQVGQTGEKVAPRVYIACGISGSIQHFAGMKMSGMIIAINTNPDAAIVSNCDYYILGDLFDIIPLLTEQLTVDRP